MAEDKSQELVDTEMVGQEPQDDQENVAPQEDNAAGGNEKPRVEFDEAYVKELRSEAAKYRRQVRDLQAQLEGRDARLSEIEQRALQLEQTIAEAVIKADFIEKAISHGVRNIRLAYLAAQAEGLLGAYDEEDGVTEHNFEELRKRFPELFSGATRSDIDAGAGARQNSHATINDLIRAYARR